jgi:hypothetical protein
MNPDDSDDHVEVLPDYRPTIVETPDQQTARMLLFAKEAVEAGMYEEAQDVVSAVRLRIERAIHERGGQTLEEQGSPYPLDTEYKRGVVWTDESWSDFQKGRNNVKKHI